MIVPFLIPIATNFLASSKVNPALTRHRLSEPGK